MKILITILIAAAFSSSAQINNYTYAVAFSGLVQNEGDTYMATKYKMTTKDLLASLAEGEYDEGNYTNNYFPVGSRLVYQDNVGTGDARFVVQDLAHNVICDVSDILTLEISPSIETIKGVTITYTYQETMVFNYPSLSWAPGYVFEFSVSYFTTETISKGIHTCKASGGSGSGDITGGNFVTLGSCSSTTK